ncbi:MAG: PAS domain-containing protein [Spirochaeta sp.]|jgi:PAS domain-containing protein|nr:PAS domain-containing protein [Spirochaeta sp.]
MDRTITRAFELFRDVAVSDQLPWWEWDFRTNKVTASPLKSHMLGYEPADFVDAGYEAFTGLIHPDDFEATMQAMRDHLSGNAPLYQTDYRIKARGGDFRWYFDRGAIIEPTDEGKHILERGVGLDLGPEFGAVSGDEAVVQAIRALLPRADADDPIVLCSQCGRVRIGAEEWRKVGADFHKGFPGAVSHTLCHDCIHTLYPDTAAQIIAHTRELDAK